MVKKPTAYDSHISWYEALVRESGTLQSNWQSSWWRITWKHFPHYWPFLRGIYRWPVNSLHKGQWRGALIFPLICAWISGWTQMASNAENVSIWWRHHGLARYEQQNGKRKDGKMSKYSHMTSPFRLRDVCMRQWSMPSLIHITAS